MKSGESQGPVAVSLKLYCVNVAQAVGSTKLEGEVMSEVDGEMISSTSAIAGDAICLCSDSGRWKIGKS